MTRKKKTSLWGWVVAAVIAPTMLMSAVWANAANSLPPQTDDIHPAQGYPLDCEGDLAMAYTVNYVPKDEAQRKVAPPAATG